MFENIDISHAPADVLDIILKDVKDFDPKIWVYAAGISLSALVVLGLTVCILLLRDHYLEMEEKRMRGKLLTNGIIKFSITLSSTNKS